MFVLNYLLYNAQLKFLNIDKILVEFQKLILLKLEHEYNEKTIVFADVIIGNKNPWTSEFIF